MASSKSIEAIRYESKNTLTQVGDIVVLDDEIIDAATGEILGERKAASRLTINQMQARLASKSQRYWAQMRNNLALMERSDKVDQEKCDQVRAELGRILDLGILNYPQTMSEAGLGPDMTLSEKKIELDICYQPEYSENECKFLKKGAHNAAQARKQNWAWRIAQEAQEKQEAGWYPFFVTLTVDPKRFDPKKIWQDSKYFRGYIRSLANIVCKELGGAKAGHPPCNKPPYRPESDYVTYAGVIEHGKSREHHHGHFVIWLREIPARWKLDPNAGISDPKRRIHNECLPMRTIWEYSDIELSPALYFRTIGDIWSTKFEFVTPVKKDKKTGRMSAMKMAPPWIAGAYITKYLQKEHKEWHHRMRATRNLGMTKLKVTLATIHPKIAEALSWRPESASTNTSIMTIHSVPLGLIRSEATRIHFLNRYKSRQLDIKGLLQSNGEVFSRMLESVRNGARPDRMGSLAFYDWVGSFLPAIEGYSKSRLFAAHVLISKIYPRQKKVAKHVKIGGNKIGNS